MGLGRIGLSVYVWMARHGLLQPGSVLDLGSQELFVKKCPELVTELFGSFGVTVPSDMVSAGDLMRALGFEYESIDIDGKFGAHRYDLNKPINLDGVYDFVTNHGTTEHCFDQAECFRTIHRACRPEGLMVHCVPFRGYDRHCFYLYKPELFYDLAEANRYEMIGIWTSQDVKFMIHAEGLDILKPHVRASMEPELRAGNLIVSCIMRKRNATDFVPPIQKDYQI
jgi:SAM-dependent methyltransferase